MLEYQKYLTNPPIPFGGYQPKTMNDDEIKEQINKEADRCMKILGRMTREEIRIQTIAQLERISGMLGSMGEKKDWTEYAIRALEQEAVIDKIRAEIKQYQSDYDVHGTEYDRTTWKAFNRCLQIIDKYRASEDKDVSIQEKYNK